jgi:hypothetical protein
MATNTFQNPVMYTNEVLAILQNNIVLGKKVRRTHQDAFGKASMKIGDTLNIRRPARFTTQTGTAFSAQNYVETSIPLVVSTQNHVDTEFTSVELTLKDQDFSDRVIKPAAIQLAQSIDQAGYLNAINSIGNWTGTAGTVPNTSQYLFDMGKKLDDFSAPRDGERYAVLEQGTTATLVPALQGLFNPQAQIAGQYKEGLFSDTTGTIGFQIAMSQNTNRHTTGPLGGAPTTDGANQGITSGWANTMTLNTKGWTAAAAARVVVGDHFTINGIYAVNPVTKQSTGQLLQFVVLENASSDGAGLASFDVSPCIISAGPFQNATARPADAIALTFLGTASTAYNYNLAWHRDAFELAVVPLIDMSPFGAWGSSKTQNGFSVRVVRQAAISTDTVGTRLDTLYGWASVYPELATNQIAGV